MVGSRPLSKTKGQRRNQRAGHGGQFAEKIRLLGAMLRRANPGDLFLFRPADRLVDSDSFSILTKPGPRGREFVSTKDLTWQERFQVFRWKLRHRYQHFAQPRASWAQLLLAF